MELQAQGVSRQYFRKGKGTNVFTAVHETDLTLTSGTLTEVAGRSGSGKSTLLNMLAGLLSPTAGKVLIDGADLYAMAEQDRARFRNRHMGIIPQGQTALRALTVLENILLPTQLYEGSGEEEWQESALALLDQVHIGHLKDVYPDELSGGERKRMAIARALIMKPGLLFADEPTSDLDDENTQEVLQLLRDCAGGGMAVLLVTHETGAAAYADKVYRMNEGVLSQEAAD